VKSCCAFWPELRWVLVNYSVQYISQQTHWF